MRLGKVWLEAEGLADALAGQIVPAHLSGDQPQQTQRIDILRVHLQDLPVQTLRLLQCPRLMVLHGQRQRLGNARHACPPVLSHPMVQWLHHTTIASGKAPDASVCIQPASAAVPAYHPTRFTFRFASRSGCAIPPRCAGRPRPNRPVGAGGRGDDGDTTGCPRARRSQRQSAANGRASHTGPPRAPARCGTEVHEEISRSTFFSTAAVSLNVSSRCPSSKRGNAAGSPTVRRRGPSAGSPAAPPAPAPASRSAAAEWNAGDRL